MKRQDNQAQEVSEELGKEKEKGKKIRNKVGYNRIARGTQG